MKRRRSSRPERSPAAARTGRAAPVARSEERAGGATTESPARARRAGGERALLACVSLLGTCTAAWIFVQVSAIRPLVEWDEGGYLWKAHLVADALRHLDLGKAWRFAAADPLKPPLQ